MPDRTRRGEPRRRKIPVDCCKPLFAVVSVLTFSACAPNLDAECAELFEELTQELDHVLDAETFDERVRRIGRLQDFREEILHLKEQAGETISRKITSGEIYSELNPEGPSDPSRQKLIFDDLNRRKAIALNAFNQRRFQIGTEALEAAGHEYFDRESVMYQAVELSFACNQTLR